MRSSEPTLKDESVPMIELQKLVDRCLGKLDLVDKLINRFKGSLQDSTEKLQQAMDLRDFVELAQGAHRLRGEAANLNATRITKLALKLETAAREEDDRASQDCLNELIEASDQFEMEVRPFSMTSNIEERFRRLRYKGF
ncbi:Hpt domain protein [Thalassoglobus neptunius]|uniref:Hpt domain protein n=1 Tax=Thalassoglobus neptunius TaxID=1938619 RepID=A0A5C5WAN3_9PLAN|nr:Hpt domain-containing protein [Thalassoglobus neptunius]TWT47129.1 Hpt domain protein [Thalassoglobus neptunius]